LPAAVGLFLAVPAIMIVATFAVAYPYRERPPPEFRLGPLAAIRCLLHEVFSYTAVYVFLQPWPRLALPREPGASPADRPTIVLVHGYACNAGVWAWLARRWAARGYAVHTATLEPVFAHIEDYVAPLARRIDEVAGAGGRVALVTHSMGGLVARAYLRRHGGAKVVRLVTLGAPHHGSALAPIGYGGDAEDMRPMAEWLRGLAAAGQPAPAAPIVSIFTWHDNFVVPQTSSVLAGAKNVPLGGIGHLSLLFSPRVAALVEAELAAPAYSRASTCSA
jgi:pimeloyl-ACP methyl ester carboxylesterase